MVAAPTFAVVDAPQAMGHALLAVPLTFAVQFGMTLNIVLHVLRQSNKVVVEARPLQQEG